MPEHATPDMRLTHLDSLGNARMVNVGDKAVTRREAQASGFVVMRPATLDAIVGGDVPKGDVFATARLAGIMAAKRTDELIPLCHRLGLDGVNVTLSALPPDRVAITARVAVTARTGVEMEALTAVSVAALTIYDMCKALDRSMRIGDIQLDEKSGGRSGHYQREKQ
ncbi:cyclic pyranopterin monophosphate synthase MoaC [Actinoallomurus vinaceus]|uniref:Cyclic pyranopterin monophosphate synthase n=1 Tax=Actinoallomurus vinaceus TaxID=1080074 RepID=A0ABP8UUS6_9ACTN